MNIALIGATGFVGSRILDELIQRSHQVIAIARQVDQIKNRDHIIAMQLDIMQEGRLASALRGNDVVVSAFNAGWNNPHIYEDYLEGARHILTAVKEAEIPRFLVVSGAGSLLNEQGERLVDAPDFPKEIKAGALAAADFMEILVRESDLDWTVFSPAVEMNTESSGTRTGNYRTGTDYPVLDHNGKSRLSAEDLAVVVADEIENRNFIRRRFTAAY